MIITKIYNDPMEVPNTDYTAIRCKNYTVVLNENGGIKGILGADKTLFEVADWCKMHDQAYKKGFSDGYAAAYKRRRKR